MDQAVKDLISERAEAGQEISVIFSEAGFNQRDGNIRGKISGWIGDSDYLLIITKAKFQVRTNMNEVLAFYFWNP